MLLQRHAEVDQRVEVATIGRIGGDQQTAGDPCRVGLRRREHLDGPAVQGAHHGDGRRIDNGLADDVVAEHEAAVLFAQHLGVAEREQVAKDPGHRTGQDGRQLLGHESTGNHRRGADQQAVVTGGGDGLASEPFAQPGRQRSVRRQPERATINDERAVLLQGPQ